MLLKGHQNRGTPLFSHTWDRCDARVKPQEVAFVVLQHHPEFNVEITVRTAGGWITFSNTGNIVAAISL